MNDKFTDEMLEDLEKATWPQSAEDFLVQTFLEEIERETMKELQEKPKRLKVSFEIDTESDFLTRWKNGEFDEVAKRLNEQLIEEENEYWRQKEQQ